MRTWLFVLALTAGCGGHAPASASASAPAATHPAAVLELGELTLFDGNDAMLKVHADGTTELGGRSGRLEVKPGETASTDQLPVQFKAGPTLSPDGTIVHGGKPIGRVTADGKIVIDSHGELPVQVTADRVTFRERPGAAFELGGDGTYRTVGGNRSLTGRVEGANTPGKRKTVLALVAILFAGAPTSSTASSSSVAPAP